MGLSKSKRFSTDTLRVEISGPEQAYLTMADLPGLLKAGSKDQSEEDAPKVKSMVMEAMKRPRSVILAVVSAKNEFSNQEVTELARKLYPYRIRTLGLITKPDTLDRSSDSERNYIELVQSQNVVFNLGWHVLKNRSWETRDTTAEQRDEAEEKFFSEGAWTAVDSASLDVKALRRRLSNVFRDQILGNLPNLLGDVQNSIKKCEGRLAQLGEPQGTIVKQRQYLVAISQKFSTLMKAAVGGIYNDVFFDSAMTDDGYRRRYAPLFKPH